MTDETENLDSLNEETETNDSPNVETVEETTETTEETQVDDVEALKEQNRQLFARAKKAEGFVLQDGKWLKPKAEVKAEPPKEGLSGEEAVDYWMNIGKGMGGFYDSIRENGCT